MSNYILALLLLLIAFSLLHLTGKKRRLPPGPTPWPIVRSLLVMLQNKPYFRWVIDVAEGRDITWIRLGAAHAIIVNSPFLAREFLKKHDASFASRPITMATEYLGRGFLSVVNTPWGDQWKKMRRVMTSVLSSARLRQQEGLRREEADHLLHYVYKMKCKRQKLTAIDFRSIVRYYTGNIIRRMVFGRRVFEDINKLGFSGKEEEEHVQAAFTVLSLANRFCPSDYIPSLRWLDLDGDERNMKKAIKGINKYHDPIIDERVKRWRASEDDESRRGKKKKMEDILDALISAEDSTGNPLLTVEEIKAESAQNQL